MGKLDLTGQKFGKLTAIKIDENNKTKKTKWICKCDCGNYTSVSTSNLKSGHTKSCGCITKQETIIGQTFNNLKVIEHTDKKNSYGQRLYLCQCLLCGNTILASKANLKRGEIKNCGNHRTRTADLVGERFGRLKVIDKIYVNNRTKYVCLCDCGNKVTISRSSLIQKGIKSCGCLQKDKVKELYVDGTAPCKLKSQKLRSTNTSGVTGVYWDKTRHLWTAEIMFKNKKYYLGRYASFEKAVNARKTAEEQIFGNFLEWYEENIKNKCDKNGGNKNEF